MQVSDSKDVTARPWANGCNQIAAQSPRKSLKGFSPDRIYASAMCASETLVSEFGRMARQVLSLPFALCS